MTQNLYDYQVAVISRRAQPVQVTAKDPHRRTPRPRRIAAGVLALSCFTVLLVFLEDLFYCC